MGWLREEPSDSNTDFQRNAACRPVIPDLALDVLCSEDAPRDIKLLALIWAKEWLGIPGSLEEDAALSDLDRLFTKGRRDHVSNEGRILMMASRALYHWRQAAVHERTRRSFPWLRFFAVEGKANCQHAEAISGRLFADGKQPLIPLPSCDSTVCHCVCLGVTAGQYKRLVEAGE